MTMPVNAVLRPTVLPEHLFEAYQRLAPAIRQRLDDFRQVPVGRYFYECCFCLCTPQSRALSADAVVGQLAAMDFLEQGASVERVAALLRQPEHYIRFHTTKAARICRLRETWPTVQSILVNTEPPRSKRAALIAAVDGYGLKEASHLLRNIGVRDLAIIDRHFLRNLVGVGLYETIPAVAGRRAYLAVEDTVLRYAADVGIPLDELDLLFWSAVTGHIFK